MPPRVFRASEIGEYLYCQRAWWLRRTGVEPKNRAALEAGTAAHESHARTVAWTGCLRTLAFVLILTAIVVAVIGGMMLLVG
jgi:CRISPR/Cas system-associated exonuclease Cas4 (RecB family)